jgi:hypothetical protein
VEIVRCRRQEEEEEEEEQSEKIRAFCGSK